LRWCNYGLVPTGISYFTLTDELRGSIPLQATWNIVRQYQIVISIGINLPELGM